MKRWKYVLPSVAALMIACSSAHDKDSDKTGNLALSLTATDNQGEVYRLRNASFVVYGYPNYAYPSSSGGAGGADESYYYSETISTESAPNAQEIVRRVVPGTYYITFDTSQPWYIEHETANGPERVQHSVLLSSTQQYAYVYDRGTSFVFYQFGVDGRTIDFRHGDIHIGIGIEHPNQDDGGTAGAPGAAGAFGF